MITILLPAPRRIRGKNLLGKSTIVFSKSLGNRHPIPFAKSIFQNCLRNIAMGATVMDLYDTSFYPNNIRANIGANIGGIEFWPQHDESTVWSPHSAERAERIYCAALP